MRYILIAALFILTSCTTTGHDTGTQVALPETGRGLVTFSTSANETSLSKVLNLQLINGQSHKVYDKVIIMMNSKFQKSSFSDVHATVRSLNLPVGKYYLKINTFHPYYKTKEGGVYEFEVLDKDITYIGNIHLGDGYTTYSHKYRNRDIQYFLSNNPQIPLSNIRMQAAKTTMRFEDLETKGIIWKVP